MRARLPACRSYLLNEAERPDNRLAARRSQSMARRSNRPRKTYEPASGDGKGSSSSGTEGGDDDKSNVAFNYEPISAPSSRCAPLERILLQHHAFLPGAAFIVKYAHRIIVSRIFFFFQFSPVIPRALLRRAPSLG